MSRTLDAVTASRPWIAHIDDDRVNLLSLHGFTEKIVARGVFDKDYFVTFPDEMPLYGSPSPELLANFNSDVEAYVRAASLCA